MTAEDIIRQARELDPSFDAQRHPQRVAINRLSRLQRRLVAEWVKVDKDAVVETFEVTFPLADFNAGVELVEGESVQTPIRMTAVYSPLDVWYRGHIEPADLELITRSDRNRSAVRRAAWLEGNTLRFTGEARLWSDVRFVRLSYAPTPEDIAALDEELVLPDTAEDALVTGLAAFFASRSNDRELARPRREYQAEAADSEALWLSELRHRRGAITSRTRMVW